VLDKHSTLITGHFDFAGSTLLQQAVIDSAVVPLLPALLHHQSPPVRLAAAWLATNLAYSDEGVVAYEETQV